MGKPTYPDSIVIRNDYYPSGLTQGMVWDHYTKYKSKILKEVRKKPIILFIFVQESVSIVRRFYNYNLIKLTKKNFDKVINGRTVSISSEQPSNTLDYFCVDIDPPGHLANDENDLKECVSDILDVYGNLSMVKKVRVTNSGRSYHVYGYLNKPMKGSSAIRFLSKTLQYNVRGKYSINSRRGGKVKINLDFTPMYLRGSHTVPWSLCRNGLMCKDITKTFESFRRDSSIIR